ncbi:MAG: hypothetical protein HY883_04665 [Deltaproteobacteria bacterium]|nr:hypothetical protein [Deltaproteobacteria bacterium]
MRPVVLSAIALIFLAVTPAFSDTLSNAERSIENFSAERDTLLASLPKEDTGIFLRERSVEKEKALASIKTLRWSEEPGKRRYKSTKKIVENYTEEELRALKALAASSTPSKKAALEKVIESLSGVKTGILQKLDESFKDETIKNEAGRKKEPPPVPSVDKSPFEQEPREGTRGIWER